MSALAQKQNGYMEATRSVGMPREVEYHLFSQITGRLNRANKEGADFALLAEALHENVALWRTIGLSVAEPENELPPQLRAQLFYLFEFTREHTPKVLRGEADAAALIDINTNIMRGLRQSAPEQGLDQCQV